ncbi:hypothetical protein B0H13DRAFT_2330115 [Mycena leptocephala]|nr:hypothetical protein B0H13DRAFT_2330115 [Mycena leptocephala]
MPPQPTAIHTRLDNITACLTMAGDTLKILANNLEGPLLWAISNTTQSLSNNLKTVKHNKTIYTRGELPPRVLNQIGKFTETLHKIHTYVEAQHRASKVQMFFRQGDMNTLLKDAKAGLQQAMEFFQIKALNITPDIRAMKEDAEKDTKKFLT